MATSRLAIWASDPALPYSSPALPRPQSHSLTPPLEQDGPQMEAAEHIYYEIAFKLISAPYRL
jgi:hypothetical protein